MPPSSIRIAWLVNRCLYTTQPYVQLQMPKLCCKNVCSENKGCCIKSRTAFEGLYSLYMAFYGLFDDIFEILRVLAIWGTKNFQNRTIFDRATDQNVKVYQKSFWQNWWFSKAQKSWTPLKINNILPNSID